MKILRPVSLLLLATLFLSACTISMSDSLVVISEDYLTDQNREELVELVHEKAKSLGGECKLLSPKRQYYRCTSVDKHEGLRMGIGYLPKGQYAIVVSSEQAHAFPPRADSVVSGKFIGDTQKELEVWMRSIVPEDAIVRAERLYIGHDAVHEF